VATGFLSHRHPQEPGHAADGCDAQGRRHPRPGRLLRCPEATSCEPRQGHKDDFSGTQATPRLAAQREDYLLKALREFKSGKRVGGGVAAMADVVYPLVDDDLRALARFLAQVPS
jgi:cytochrome c553